MKDAVVIFQTGDRNRYAGISDLDFADMVGAFRDKARYSNLDENICLDFEKVISLRGLEVECPDYD